VSKDKAVNKAKRKNVVKMGAGKIKEADLLKMKKEMDKKKSKKDEAKQASGGVPSKAIEEEKKEEESEEPIKKEEHKVEKEEIKFLELTPNEERDIK
jgi:hypothetical protein